MEDKAMRKKWERRMKRKKIEEKESKKMGEDELETDT